MENYFSESHYYFSESSMQNEKQTSHKMFLVTIDLKIMEEIQFNVFYYSVLYLYYM